MLKEFLGAKVELRGKRRTTCFIGVHLSINTDLKSSEIWSCAAVTQSCMFQPPAQPIDRRQIRKISL